MYAPFRLRFLAGRTVFRSFSLASLLCGLTACAVGPDSPALQAGSASEARLEAGAPLTDGSQPSLSPTEAGLRTLNLMSQGAEALATGDAAAAVGFLDQALAAGEDSTALFLRGVAHLELGELELARADLGRTIALDPDDIAAYCALSRARRASGDLEGAVEAVTRAVELAPDDARLLTLQGHMLLEAGHVDLAYEALQAAVKLDPENLETRRALGMLFSEAGDSESAEGSWRDALKLAPDDVLLHAGLANTLRDLGRDAEAVESYRAAVRLEPGNPVHLANLGSTYFRLEQMAQARDAYESALALDALPPRSHSFVALNYGIVLEHLGDDAGAMDAYREAIASDTTRAEAHESLGLLLLDRGDEPGAFEQLGAAFDLELVSPEAVLHLGLLADRLGVPERARQCAALLDAWEETDAAVAYRRAQLLVRCQDPEVNDVPTAIAILEDLVAGPLSGSASTWNMLSEALSTAGRFDDALQAADRALELVAPGDPAWNRSRDLREHCLISLVGP